MIVYAAFLCFSNGYCNIFGNPHMTGQNSYEMVPFETLAECQSYIRGNTMGQRPGPDGRTMLDGGQTYWECRGKHVDTWEAAQ